MSTARQTAIHSWLRKQLLGACALRLAAAIGLVALGAAILFVTYWFVYGLCYFVMSNFGMRGDYYAWIAGVFLVLLFIGNARTDRRYLSEFSVTTGTFSNEVVTFYMPGVGLVSNINPLAPDSVHTFVKVITSILFTGPRAVVAAWRTLRSAFRYARIDTAACAAILTFLHQRPSRADFRTIMDGVPGINPIKHFPQVAEIEGVLVLSSEPAGLSLGSELWEDLDHVLSRAATIDVHNA